MGSSCSGPAACGCGAAGFDDEFELDLSPARSPSSLRSASAKAAGQAFPGCGCGCGDADSDDESEGEASPVTCASPLSSAVAGPKRVLLMRHGQAEHNVSDCEVPDALLTATGRAQAAAWHGCAGGLGAEVVLVSPLRRAVQTACLAFQDDRVPMEICWAARELWWEDESNLPGTPADLRRLLKVLPRGSEVQRVEEELTPSPCDPPDEEASVEQLRCLLRARTERTVAVACHWGVIDGLCGVSAGNGDIVECELTAAGELAVVAVHQPPAWSLGAAAFAA